MATMHPEDPENYNPTKSERQMYDALKEQLPDKIHVFYSVRWFDKSEEKRIDSECDFLVFDPSFGFIVIEVKGGIDIKCEGEKWTLILDEDEDNADRRELKCSPYVQADKSVRHFKERFEREFNMDYQGVYGCAAAFPLYSAENKIPKDHLDITIDLNDMSSLEEKINQIFGYWKGKKNIDIPFSESQSKKLMKAINGQISMAAAAGALIDIKEKEFVKINLIQDSVLDFLYNYNQVRIVGGAGTGKTFVGIKKAKRDANDGLRVLFICCSEELAVFVKSQLIQFPDVAVYTYDELLENHADEKYDSVIVDEAQDFDSDMGQTVRGLLKNAGKSSLYVFYDKNQNVYETSCDNVFSIDTPPYVLRYNIRNTARIYKCAVDRTNLGDETRANNILGVEPDVRDYSQPHQTIDELGEIVNNLVKKEFVPLKSIVILSDTPYVRSVLKEEKKVGDYDLVFKHFNDAAENEICFKTAEEFKGLEANVVIYLKHEFSDIPPSPKNNRKDYVAITRARYYLYILNTEM